LSSSDELDIEALRGAVLTKVLRLYVAFGALLVSWAIFQNFRNGDYALIVLHASLYATLVFVLMNQWLSHRTRTNLLVLTLLGVALSEFVLYGPFGEGSIFLVSALALVALMIGRRAGYVSVALAVATLLVVSSLHVSGHLTTHWLRDLKADRFDQWTTTLVEIAVFCSALNFMITTLFDQLVAGMEAQRQSELRYKLLAEHVGDVIWTVDHNLRCTYVSPSMALVFGRTAADVLGGDLGALGMKDLEHGIVAYTTPLSGDGEGRGQSKRIVGDVLHRDGHLVPTETVVTMLYGVDGDAYGALGVTRDISARVALEKERESLQSQLRMSQRMESIGQLAGGIAHDLNNLLQGMFGYAELSLEKVPEATPVRANIEEIMKTCERARQLVQQLLAFGRRQVLELSTVNLNDLITDLAGIIHRVIGEHITFEFSGAHDLHSVQADPGQIEQVLMNLCVNARDAMPGGGTLRIETSNKPRNASAQEPQSQEANDRIVVVTISDTGCGMDDATREQIFEPFFTTKEVGKGTGLGLSTAFGIMQQHNGSIDVASAPGAGSTFRLCFPAALKQAEPAPPPRAAIASGGSETILLADDNPTVLQVTELMLRGAGYNVIAARDGAEAIAQFDAHSKEVDLALLDVVMPGLGGKDVARHISAHRPEVPIVFCSGYSDDSVHTNFVLDEGTTLIAKPYKREDLLRTLRNSLGDQMP